MAVDQADQFLVQQINKGDEQAWQQLIERYQGRLFAFARSRIASIADAEDIVQDAFIGFLQSLQRYDTNRSLETYLFTILRYKITDHLRGQSSGTQALMGQADDWWEETTPAESESPSGIAIDAEASVTQSEILAEVLRRLIRDLRDRSAFDDLQIIELLFYAGQRNNGVADLLEVDEKHVAGVKYRAIQRIRKYLEDMEPERIEALSELQADATVCRVWREQRVTCLKRSTLGQYLLGVLEQPWFSYTQFHLDVVACPMCLANLEDLEAEEAVRLQDSADSIFASSVGFLSRASQSGT